MRGTNTVRVGEHLRKLTTIGNNAINQDSPTARGEVSRMGIDRATLRAIKAENERIRRNLGLIRAPLDKVPNWKPKGENSWHFPEFTAEDDSISETEVYEGVVNVGKLVRDLRDGIANAKTAQDELDQAVQELAYAIGELEKRHLGESLPRQRGIADSRDK